MLIRRSLFGPELARRKFVVFRGKYQIPSLSILKKRETLVKQYDGLKYSGDHQDAFHLAHLMRLGILPTGYIYPKAQRAVRDLLRRRLSLVRSASAQLISVQSQIWRSSGIRIKSDTLRKPGFETTLLDGYTLQAANSGLVQ